MLFAAGSAWQVVEVPDATPSLERRVEAPVEQAARTEMERGGNAGRHLPIAALGSPAELAARFDGPDELRAAVSELRDRLYAA